MTPPIRSAQAAPVAKPIQKTQKLDSKATESTESIYDQLDASQNDWEGEMCRFDRDMPTQYCSPEQSKKTPRKQAAVGRQGQQAPKPSAQPNPGVPNAAAKPSAQPEVRVGGGPAYVPRGGARLSEPEPLHPCQDGTGVDLADADYLCTVTSSVSSVQ